MQRLNRPSLFPKGGLLLIRSYPSPFMPDTLQRPLFILGQPPFAKPYLQQERGNSNPQTHRISAIRSKIKTEREINDRSYYRLAYIIGKTHLSIKTQIANRVAEPPVLVKEHERCYQYQRESQFLPHVKCSTHGLLSHNQFLQRI